MLKKAFITFVGLSLLFLLALPVFAQENVVQKESVTLAKDQTINKDYFATGESVTISGTINGDLYAFGGNVLIDGTVNGDVITAGGTVTITGKVSHNVRAAAGTLHIDAPIGRNISFAAGTVDIAKGAKIEGSLVGAGGTVNIFAPIGKEIIMAAGNSTIGNSVHGDVVAGVGDLGLTHDATISGNLTYWSRHSAKISSSSSQVTGSITHNIPTKDYDDPSSKFWGMLNTTHLLMNLVSFLATLLLGVGLILFLPQFTIATSSLLSRRPFLSMGVGLLTLIGVPFICLLLVITVIGIPFGVLLILLYGVAIYFSKIFLAFVIGQKVTQLINRKHSPVIVMILGVVLYYALSTIPLLGGLLSFFGTLMGLGALVISKKNLYQKLRSQGDI